MRSMQSIKGARSYFEERSLERAPFENTGAEAGARSFVQMSIIQIIESIHKWDRQNSFAYLEFVLTVVKSIEKVLKGLNLV